MFDHRLNVCSNIVPLHMILGVREAYRLGVKAIEFDVRLTSDNQPIAFHDDTADRTTDKSGKKLFQLLDRESANGWRYNRHLSQLITNNV